MELLMSVGAEKAKYLYVYGAGAETASYFYAKKM